MTYSHKGLAALANPTRRRVFELIAGRPQSVAELAGALPVSQPAVSQHLKVLREARLVRGEPRGASNIYHLDPQGVAEIRAWLDRMWGDALEAFRNEANKMENER